MEELLRALHGANNGEPGTRLAGRRAGLRGEIAQAFNALVDRQDAFTTEVARVAEVVRRQGRTSERLRCRAAFGTWTSAVEATNSLIDSLVRPTTEVSRVISAVAEGDLNEKMLLTIDGQPATGDFARIATVVNSMVDQLRSFAHEVTRVAGEVGTEGRLGGQADVPGVSGTWKDLTDNVNRLAGNLTGQVRNIAQVTTAVAKGDLSQKITVDARGEVAELKETINTMVDQLSAFAAEVTRVAREVGTEGKLGGQAEVTGVSGTWARLTENVNQLAGNLTGQVRAIAEVATAVTAGDLSRQVTIEAPGELGELKDNINQMIENLRATTARNEAQDWLNSNLARISAMLQGQRDLRAVSQLIMSELTPLVGASFGAFYIARAGEGDEKDAYFELLAGFGASTSGRRHTHWRVGEGLVGQVAIERRAIVLEDVPSHGIRIRAGSVDAPASFVVLLPVIFEGHVLAVIELASFRPFPEVNRRLLAQIVETVGVVINTIQATSRTEELLAQSQKLTKELQSQSAELQRKQDELQRTNAEIELARGELEERADQLATSSRYKSEFLANMSHELRTPLNSLLILARMLSVNASGNLSEREVAFAQSIYEAGNDLLELINSILDLSKVEAGKLEVALAPVSLATLRTGLEQVFQPVATEKQLSFEITLGEGLPEAIVTDQQRVEQVLKNLLSNAFKFTEHGSVELRVDAEELAGATRIVFCVADTGIGIPEEEQHLIFEAFQQADGTTSRRYGGTGLGLSISREVAHLLGGELRVESSVGCGSAFSLVLPLTRRNSAPSSPRRRDRRRAEEHPAEPEPSLRGAQVLIVDDDVRNLYALASALEGRGIEVYCADSGQQCLKLLEATPGIDLVLMDIMMPEMDGYETIRRIRRSPERADLPVIAVTAKAMRGDREASLAAGASDYVTKPVELPELLRVLRVWLHDGA